MSPSSVMERVDTHWKAFWLYRCASCGHEDTKLALWSDRVLACPQEGCEGLWERVYTAAPAVQDDILTGGARWMHNLDDFPVWVATKTQLQAELGKRGLVQDVRDNHNEDDKTPWATRTRLRVGARDPFLTGAAEPAPSPDVDQVIPSSTGTVERTTGQVDDVTVEAVNMSVDQLRTFRSYRRLLGRMHLRQELFCAKCWDRSPDDVCEVNTDGDSVFVVCACSIRFGTGQTAFMADPPVPPVAPQRLLVVPGRTPPEFTLDSRVARAFRAYKATILGPLSLKEALRCDTCHDRQTDDGCRGHVTGTEMSVECRCSTRTFTGYTT